MPLGMVCVTIGDTAFTMFRFVTLFLARYSGTTHDNDWTVSLVPKTISYLAGKFDVLDHVLSHDQFIVYM